MKKTSDQLHYENIIYNSQELSIEAAYADNALMDVYFDMETSVLALDNNIYLFDTDEERENLVNQQLTSRSNSGKRFNLSI